MSSYGAPRGGGRGRGRGRGRGHFGGGSGGRGDGPPNHQSEARLKPCRTWTTTGTCPHNNNCKFSHAVKLHASIDASSVIPENNNNNNHSRGGYNQNQQPRQATVSAIAIWETQGIIKIFTGSHDGYWRLWNTQDNKFVKEFEHDMGGKVNCLEVASNFLFCGFESVAVGLPNVRVGMIHCWNLASPADPPLEFQAQLKLVPYAHGQAVTRILVVGGDQVISGSQDGGIRVWRFDATAGGGKGMFLLARTLLGHAREVTGLVIVESLLWSSSIDGSIRLWDLAQNGDCQYAITSTDGEAVPPNTPQQNGAPSYNSGPRSNAFTDLITFKSPTVGSFVLGSSLNQTVKAWNGSNGECVANESHGDGVVCMALSTDLKGNPILLIGLEKGDIMVRNVLQTPSAPGFCLLLKLSYNYTAGHMGPVKAIREGPANTFYTVGADGKLLIWQFTGDLGL